VLPCIDEIQQIGVFPYAHKPKINEKVIGYIQSADENGRLQ
jgi:hypothetical protein